MRVVFVFEQLGPAEMAGRDLGGRLGLSVLAPILSPADAMARLPVENPEIVIFEDRDEEDCRGLDLMSALKLRLRGTRWLLYSAGFSPAVIFEGFTRGLDGAVAKNQPTAMLDQAIIELLAGRRFFCQVASKMLDEALVPTGLTPTERRILYWIAAGLDTKEIAAALKVSPKTVLNELVVLRRKTGVRTMVQLAEFARAHGHAPLRRAG